MKRNRIRNQALFSSSKRNKRIRPRQKWRIRYVLWTALKRTCMIIGALVLFSALISILSLSAVFKETVQPLPDQIVLYMPLDGPFLEHRNIDNFFGSAFLFRQYTVREVINALDVAAKDKRVKGLVLDLRNYPGGFALSHVQEIRNALRHFQNSGKFAYFYSSSIGEGGGGISTYYLASTFDEIWVQPAGTLLIPGIQMEAPYFRPVLDKLGIQPQFLARKEYKNVFESAKSDSMSDPEREMMTAIIDDLSSQVTEVVVEERVFNPAVFNSLIDKGIFPAEEARQEGLVDVVGYIDQLQRSIKKDVTGNPDTEDRIFVELSRYLKGKVNENKVESVDFSKKPKIALIYIEGTIMSGNEIEGAGKWTRAINEAAMDENVKAIVVRINSPGGSPTAAETIYRSIKRAKERGKQVIVSMGGMAASAGYWIAAPADYIFTAPATLTGSIGVAGGKVSLQGLWEKIGVNWETISWGNNSGMWSMNTPFSESEMERMNILMDATYSNFLARVAEGRSLDMKQVEEIARGRAWTGQQAIEIGLADELGGLTDALDYAATLAGAKNRADVQVEELPKPERPIEKIVRLMEMQSKMGEALSAQMALYSLLQPFMQELAMASRPQNFMTYQEPLLRAEP